MQLNELQLKAVEAIVNPDVKQVTVLGHAGTGKTTLVTEAIKQLKAIARAKAEASGRLEQTGPTIVGVAPTHQAKEQLMARMEGLGVPVITVAKLFKQRPFTTDIGRTVFTKGGLKDGDWDIIIVDEISMIGQRELLELSSLRSTKVIYLGDDGQLRPVMKKSADLSQLSEVTITLTEQMRNAGPILKLCSEARNAIVYPPTHSYSPDGSIFVHGSDTELVQYFIEELTTEGNNPLDYVYLAYTNVRVKAVAHQLTLALYGTVDSYVEGQLLRLNTSNGAGNNGSIVKVLTVEPAVMMGIDCQKLTVHNVVDPEALATLFCVPLAQSEFISDQIDHLTKQLANPNISPDIKAALCKELKGWTDSFDLVESPFALTIHKAQGRSIPYVFVDTASIQLGRGAEKQRLLYVAYSRAMTELHTVQPQVKAPKAPKIKCQTYAQTLTQLAKASGLSTKKDLWKWAFKSWSIDIDESPTDEQYATLITALL